MGRRWGRWRTRYAAAYENWWHVPSTLIQQQSCYWGIVPTWTAQIHWLERSLYLISRGLTTESSNGEELQVILRRPFVRNLSAHENAASSDKFVKMLKGRWDQMSELVELTSPNLTNSSAKTFGDLPWMWKQGPYPTGPPRTTKTKCHMLSADSSNAHCECGSRHREGSLLKKVVGHRDIRWSQY